MSQINDGGPAFPHDGQANYTGGMTLRDYFAAKANEDDIRAQLRMGEYPDNGADRCRARFRHADLMLAAREAQP